MENRIDEKISYLRSIVRKYYNLNKVTNDEYINTEFDILHEIDALEELKRDEPLNTWDKCYEDDLKASINLREGNKSC